MLSELSKDARTLKRSNHAILISKNATKLDSIDGKQPKLLNISLFKAPNSNRHTPNKSNINDCSSPREHLHPTHNSPKPRTPSLH